MESNFENLGIEELQEINGGGGGRDNLIGYVIGKIADAVIDMARHPETVTNSGVPSKRPI